MSSLPKRVQGRQTAAAEALYKADLCQFCDRVREIRSRIDFKVGTRGWCNLLEGEHIKGEFDAAERPISRCRKDGSLPLDICAEDDKRATNGLEKLDSADIEAEADWIVEYAGHAHAGYTPFSFWDELPVYIEMAVEKGDLKSLFSPVTQPFRIAIQNVGGRADINVRAGMMCRFKRWAAKSKSCVLLYCGDHDPGGLNISEWLLYNLKDLQNAVGWHPGNMVIDRFGLDYEFIEAYGLTWIDNLETSSGGNLADPKHPDYRKDYVQSYLRRFGVRKVEAFVARPEAGRELCRQAILRWVPEDAIEKYGAHLQEVREELRRAVATRLVG